MTSKTSGATVEVHGSEIVIRIQSAAPSAPSDRLIRLDHATCKREGFELRGLKAKVDEGLLPIVKIGRAHFVRLSDLLSLPKVADRKSGPLPKAEPNDEYEEALRSTTRRRRAG